MACYSVALAKDSWHPRSSAEGLRGILGSFKDSPLTRLGRAAFGEPRPTGGVILAQNETNETLVKGIFFVSHFWLIFDFLLQKQ